MLLLMASFFCCCGCCCRNSVLVAATIISCLSIVMLCSHVKFNLWILAKSLSAFVQSAVDAKCRQNVSPQCQCTRSIAFLHLNMLLSSQVNLVLNCVGWQNLFTILQSVIEWMLFQKFWPRMLRCYIYV